MSKPFKSWLQPVPDFELKSSPPTPKSNFIPRPLSRAQWRELKIRRQEAEKKQSELLESQDIFKLCIESKLERAGAAEICAKSGAKWYDNFLRCGREDFYVMCAICGDGHQAHYTCSQKWCPRCNWRISMKRRELLGQMTKGIYGVKHAVLTQKNFDHLTRDKIMQSRKSLFNLRRKKIFGKVTGGCASLEFTNEGKGWHMHWHLLLQSEFIPARELAVAWGELVEQEFAIVKVMDVSDKSYLAELCKYVVEGSEMSKWPAEKILEFILALRGTRCFTVFGKFREMQKYARILLLEKEPSKEPCRCGCNEIVFGHDRQHCERVAAKKGY